MLDPVGNDLDGQPFGVGYGFLYTALHRIRSRLPGKMRIVQLQRRKSFVFCHTWRLVSSPLFSIRCRRPARQHEAWLYESTINI